MSNPYLISRQRFIAAPPERIFELLATPAMHGVIDGSGTVRNPQPNGPERLSRGAKFGMEMKIGVNYKILNTVCEFDEGRRIAWRHFYGHILRYLLEPVDGGNLVTEQWDATRVKGRLALRLGGFTRRHPASITATLEKLDDFVSADPR